MGALHTQVKIKSLSDYGSGSPIYETVIY